ncbi:MAG: acetamidase, partial [Chloroflexi bacterium]
MAITHDLPLERRTLHGHFSRDLEPVLSIDLGDSVRLRTLDAGWHWDLEGEWIE